jgi:hypothetical protein
MAGLESRSPAFHERTGDLAGQSEYNTYRGNTVSTLITSQLLSNSVFAVSALAIEVMSDVGLRQTFQRVTSGSAQGEGNFVTEMFGVLQVVYNIREPEQREEVRRWPAWKTWSVIGAVSTVALGVPFLAIVGAYERIGPKALPRVTGGLGVVAGGAL